MKARLDFTKAAPGALRAMFALEQYIRSTGIETPLLELVRLRASLMNGCAYCIDMHAKDARAEGETEQRLYSVSVWRECPYYTDRERAALEWTEAVTQLGTHGVPDDVFERVHKQFSDEQLVNLTMAVISINGWNRLNVPFRTVPGSYEPQKKQQPSLV